MTRIKPPARLPELVKTAFANARRDGELHYFPTQVTVLTANSIPVSVPLPFNCTSIDESHADGVTQFQLRYSPALADKPKGPPPDPARPQKPLDPFENPPPALRLADVGPSHFLVLNKFAVVPEHFILVTREFKQQTHILEPADLEATLACIQAYEEDDAPAGRDEEGRLYAFFNSGEHSGASQPHRHIQLLPISRMRDGLVDGETAWSVLADHLDSYRPPFAVFSERIHLGMPAAELHAAYLRLYRRACRAVVRHAKTTTAAAAAASGPDGEEALIPEHGEALISYNMAMTRSTLVLSPRLAEGAKILGPDGDVLGSLALNGTVLAGTALVKNELEWETLKKDPGGLLKVLKGIGVPGDEVDEGGTGRL